MAYAVVSPVGDRSTVLDCPAQDWINRLDTNRDMPDHIKDRFREGFKRWQAGEVVEIDGTPLTAGGVFTPAEQQQLLDLHVKTIEAAARMTDAALLQYGMGGREARGKAQRYLDSTGTDVNKLHAELEALKVKLADLDADNRRLRTRLQAVEDTKATKRVPSPAVDMIERLPRE